MPHHHTPPQPAISPPTQPSFNQIIWQGIQDARQRDRQWATRTLARTVLILAVIIFTIGWVAAWHADGGAINRHGIRANRIAACQQALHQEKTAYQQLNQTRSNARTTLRQWQAEDRDPDQIARLTRILDSDPAAPVNGDCTGTPDSLTPRITGRTTQYRRDASTLHGLIEEQNLS